MKSNAFNNNNNSRNSNRKFSENHNINDDLYKSLFEYANDAIFIMDYGKFIDCNNKAVEMFGCKNKEDMLSHKPIDFSPKFQPDGMLSSKKALRYIDLAIKGNPQRFYWVHKKKNGDHFDTEVSLNKITKGPPNLLLAIVRDISFFKKMEKQLMKLSQAVEQSPASIVITDPDGNIEYVNPKFTEITGYSYEELIGNNPRILKSGWTSNEEYKNLWETITSGKIWKGTFKNKKKNGSYYWESALIAPIKDSDGNIINFIGIKEDITKQKELEEQLIQMQKLESIGTLTGGIAHDFNNILTAINGYAQLALSKIKKDDILYDYIHSILTGGERAAELVKNLLAFSRKQIIRPRIININEIIREIEKILSKTIDEDIDVYLYLDKDIMPVKADPSQFEQLLINLITNARDSVNQKTAASENKRIVIRTENEFINNSKIEKHPELKAGNYVCLTIEDNGIGMDEATLSKIFDPFFTTKPQWLGTGLGLSTVYGIVKQNNGYIDVTSQPGMGATFKIYWPAAKQENNLQNDFNPEKISQMDHMGEGEKILLVEDNDTLREFIEQSLSVAGFKVITAKDGLSALEILKDINNEKNIDIIITDIVMPKLGGIELIKKVNLDFPDIKSILITGYPMDSIENLKAIEKDVYLLKKPFKHSELISLIKRLIG